MVVHKGVDQSSRRHQVQMDAPGNCSREVPITEAVHSLPTTGVDDPTGVELQTGRDSHVESFWGRSEGTAQGRRGHFTAPDVKPL